MAWLEKNFILHERDENKKLLPIEYPIPELGGKKVLILPVSRGEILRTFSDLKLEKIGNRETWEDFAIKHILKPKFTKEDFNNMKIIRYKNRYVDLLDLLIDAIYVVSGIEVSGDKEESVKKEEEDLKKK